MIQLEKGVKEHDTNEDRMIGMLEVWLKDCDFERLCAFGGEDCFTRYMESENMTDLYDWCISRMMKKDTSRYYRRVYAEICERMDEIWCDAVFTTDDMVEVDSAV